MQSDAAEVRTLVENLYNFEAFGAKKFIREFLVRRCEIPVQRQDDRDWADISVCVLMRC